MFKRKRIIEYHKYTIIEEITDEPNEEIYPETKKKLNRPNINFKVVILKVLICTIVNLFFSEIIFYGFNNDFFLIGVFNGWLYFVLIFFILQLFAFIFRLKNVVVFAIRVYQKYAPYQVRSVCLFEPNCSEYMILAIEKYGLIRGVIKGIKRFKRCCYPNGGVDYP